jgi:hypothetical protein
MTGTIISSIAHSIGQAEKKHHFGLVCLVAKGFYFLKEPGYISDKDNPENSESRKQPSHEKCLT